MKLTNIGIWVGVSVLVVCIVLIVRFIRAESLRKEISSKKSAITAKVETMNNFVEQNNIDIGEKINIPLYYINLERSTERRKNIEYQTKYTSIDIQRIPAVDNKKIVLEGKPYDGKGSYTFENGKQLEFEIRGFSDASISELACTLSHLIAIITAYENGDEYSLIVEDDIYLNLAYNWKDDIKRLIKAAPDDWGMIQLYSGQWTKSDPKYREKYLKWNSKYCATAAYIINKKSMKVISELFNKGNIAITNNDNIESLASDIMIYKYAQLKNAQVYTIPPKFVPDNRSLESTIHDVDTKDHIRATFDVLESM